MKESVQPPQNRAYRASPPPRITHVVVRRATAEEAASINRAIARLLGAIASEQRSAHDYFNGETDDQRRPFDPHHRQ